MDRLTNFILADAMETGTAKVVATEGRKGGAAGQEAEAEADNVGSKAREEAQPGAQQRHLGVVMIPGKHLVSVKLLRGT